LDFDNEPKIKNRNKIQDDSLHEINNL